jgi:predicted dehydrogenase
MASGRAIGIGVIGMGWMGLVHSRAYRQFRDRFPDSEIRSRLVICADDVGNRAQEGRDLQGFESCTTDWREVVAHPDVEAVDITAPNILHLEMVRAAAEAGKHVSCEKPMGRSPVETAEIVAAARRAGVFTSTGFNYRLAPMVQYAHQLIRAGRLGKITHCRARFFAGYGADPRSVLSWRFERSIAGSGVLGDIMSHMIDMAHFLAGPIQSLVSTKETFIPQRPIASHGVGTHFTKSAGGELGEVTNEDYVSALVRFTNGARGTLETCRVVTGQKCQFLFEIHGTDGALSWDYERMNEVKLFLPDSPEHEGYTRICGGPNHPFFANFYPGPGNSMSYEDLKTIEAFQFLQSVKTGVQGEPGFREALAVAEVQAAIIRSWESGTWEKVQTISTGTAQEVANIR